MAHQKLAGKRKVVLEQITESVFKISEESGESLFIIGEIKTHGYLANDGKTFIYPDDHGVWPNVAWVGGSIMVSPGGSQYI